MILCGIAIAGAAQAQTVDWKWNAELRTRYTDEMNTLGVKGADANMFEGRTKIGVTFMKGDSLTGHVTLLNEFQWGNIADQASNSPADYGNHGKNSLGNNLQVQEAWGWWKSTDTFSMKFGRAGFEYGDGTIFAIDDWQNHPNAWDGIWTHWGFDFADLHLFGTKETDTDTAPVGVTNNAKDPETVAYGLVVAFKNLPEWMKHVFIHIVDINADNTAFVTGLGATSGNLMHYGLTAQGESGSLDYRLTGDFTSGKLKGATDVTLGGNMFDAEIGWNMPEVMKLRISLMAHMDTGNDSTSADKNNRYLPLFPDRHKYAGLEDVVGWGNSTYYGLGLGVQPSDDVTAGLQYLMFNKTTDKDGVMNSAGTVALAGATTEKAVGSEIDLWANKAYGENFSILGFVGLFSPGDALKAGTFKENDNKVQFQGKLTF